MLSAADPVAVEEPIAAPAPSPSPKKKLAAVPKASPATSLVDANPPSPNKSQERKVKPDVKLPAKKSLITKPSIVQKKTQAEVSKTPKKMGNKIVEATNKKMEALSKKTTASVVKKSASASPVIKKKAAVPSKVVA